MSARKTVPNARVETCRESSTQKYWQFIWNGEIAQKKIETGRQGDVMRPKEKTFLKVRDSPL